MKALAANLKTLYQCPALWFWNLIGLMLFFDAIVDPLFEPVAGNGEFVEYLLVSFWVGLVTGSMVKESWGKPLAFCLPGHREVTRSMVFVVGVGLNVLLALLVTAYPGLDGPAALAGFASAACLGMTVYLLTVSGMFLAVNSVALWGIPVLFFNVIRDGFGGVGAAMEDAALFHPVVNALVLVPVALVVWNRLGSRGVARRYSGSTFLPLQSMWNRAAMERYALSRRLTKLDRQSKALWRRVEGRFLTRMKRLPALSGRRHTHGSRYVLFGSILASSLGAVVLGALAVVLLIVILGFVPPTARHEGFSKANFLYAVPCFLGLTAQLPLYSTLLVPAGRRERYRACLSIGIRAGASALLLSATMCAVSFSVGVFLPNITYQGRTLPYLSMDPGMLLVPLLLLPLLLACQVALPRRAVILQTALLIVAIVLGLAMPGPVLLGIGFGGLAIPGMLCWWCFVGSLHHYCYYRDLAIG